MIRINAFFEVAHSTDKAQLKALCNELVEKSRHDNGNIAYDFYQSTTLPDVMMICETWQDETTLNAHKAAEHFTRLVPQIKALSKNGFKSEKFVF